MTSTRTHKLKARASLALLLMASALPSQAVSLRLHERFDGGWRFKLGDDPRAQAPDFADGGWRAVSLPHDWSIEDLPSAQARDQLVLDASGWRFRAGDDAAWKAPNFDDSAWSAFTPPGSYQELKGFAPHSFGWYRRRFSVPPAMRGKSIALNIGKVDDVDETFVNGVKVGQSGAFPPAYATAYPLTRRYIVPAQVLKGDGSDVVAIRAYNGEGSGGLYQTGGGASLQSGPFSSESQAGAAQGFTSGGIGWYRKAFVLPASLRGRRLRLSFDGVYMNSQVWLNGQRLGEHAYGYTPFGFDITDLVRLGARNVLAVKVDASGLTSRWYSGSGIYRHVWLDASAPLHIAPQGIAVSTPQVSSAQATVQAGITLQNQSGAAQNVRLGSRVLDGAGKIVASSQAVQVLAAGAQSPVSQQMVVASPRLWSPDSPSLYQLVSTVSVGGAVVDEVRIPFGIRTISIDAARGFVLNGSPLKLRGGCVHHDNGPLGSAAYDRAEFRRIEMLKAAGFNAIRTSHNPPSPAFLEACDTLGMLVMDEAFDAWAHGKNPDDYGKYFQANWQSDIRAMVERDRNHPSVVMWSIGNEIPEQASPEGNARATEISNFVRSIDPTRATTLACSVGGSPNRDAYFSSVDVAGYNYQPGDYARDHERIPTRVMQGTESFPRAAFEAWMPVVDHPYVIGDFVWTALDYLGEAGIGRYFYPGESGGFVGDYPYTVAGCGDLDLIGTRKPQSYYRGILWGVGPSVTAFVDAVPEGGTGYSVSGWGWNDERASWSWPGTEGKTRTVRVYARTPRVRLLLNNRDLGEKETTRATHFTATYTVPFEPGELSAVGLDAQGKEIARWTLKTAGVPAQLRLTPDRKFIRADGQDLSFVSVEVLDRSGNLCPNAQDSVRFSLAGPGTIAAVGNGNPQSVESVQVLEHRAFQGRCLAILKSSERSGTLRLSASINGAPVATTSVVAR